MPTPDSPPLMPFPLAPHAVELYALSSQAQLAASPIEAGRLPTHPADADLQQRGADPGCEPGVGPPWEPAESHGNVDDHDSDHGQDPDPQDCLNLTPVSPEHPVWRHRRCVVMFDRVLLFRGEKLKRSIRLSPRMRVCSTNLGAHAESLVVTLEPTSTRAGGLKHHEQEPNSGQQVVVLTVDFDSQDQADAWHHAVKAALDTVTQRGIEEASTEASGHSGVVLLDAPDENLIATNTNNGRSERAKVAHITAELEKHLRLNEEYLEALRTTMSQLLTQHEATLQCIQSECLMLLSAAEHGAAPATNPAASSPTARNGHRQLDLKASRDTSLRAFDTSEQGCVPTGLIAAAATMSRLSAPREVYGVDTTGLGIGTINLIRAHVHNESLKQHFNNENERFRRSRPLGRNDNLPS